MTSVIVTTITNKVEVTDQAGNKTVVTTPSAPRTIQMTTEGPQGPFPRQLGNIHNVDTTGVTGGSVLYYDVNEEKFKANSTWTTSSLTDGGNF